jgi:hypothetical protein
MEYINKLPSSQLSVDSKKAEKNEDNSNLEEEDNYSID